MNFQITKQNNIGMSNPGISTGYGNGIYNGVGLELGIGMIQEIGI